MKKLDFNKDWTVRCITRDTEPKPVRIPHDAMREEDRIPTSKGAGNIGWFEGGSYEYRKVFTIPEEEKGKELLLEFEGVMTEPEVFVNGEKAAYRPYGYTNFYVRLNDFVDEEKENEIRVIAHNDDQPNSRWYPGTGIYRPVWLFTGGETRIPVNGIRIRTLSYKPAVIQVEADTRGLGKLSVEILPDGQDNVVACAEAEVAEAEATTTFKIEVPSAKLWNPEDPHLYTCKVSFGDDVVCETFGIRELYWGPDKGLTINGKRVILRGACIHHDHGVLGAVTYPEAEERRVRILMENGYNAIRSAHNPCSKYLLEACDRLGMLMMDEYVDVWYMHKTQYDYANYLSDWWKQDLKDMVEKDYNHPCVIMYSTGNEVAETAQERGIKLTGDFTQYLHSLDPTRPVTCGINIFFNFLSSIGLGVYSDDKAAKEAAENAAKKDDGKKKNKPVGSEFYNTLACLVGDKFMKFGATLYPCDVKTRDAYANMDIAGYNYGLWRYNHDLKKYPNRLILGSETFCKDAYLFWGFAKRHKRIIGDFVWAGWDYIGETGIGATEFKDYYHPEDESHMTGGNGRIDLTGKPRAEAAYTRVALGRENGPLIGVLPVYEDEKLQLTGWQLTKAVESWSWRGSEGRKATVEVYARATEVELLINGRSVGRKKLTTDCQTKFTVPYEDGEITAVSYNAAGREIGRYSMFTAGMASELRVTAEEKTAKTGRLNFIRIQYTDDKGIWKPTCRDTLKVYVENGTLEGLGSANPYVIGNYAGDTVDTYFGEAQAVVMADGRGPVRVTVTESNGEAHTIEIPMEAEA